MITLSKKLKQGTPTKKDDETKCQCRYSTVNFDIDICFRKYKSQCQDDHIV